ncbi:nuclear transport factor 2 family protein [Variovorax sp. J22P271]|uniref:nuclear transport factor 2 family protein n=1 Tax=Variovorax davisae TaxID=3053515 RepID=UPI002577366E|nr:nuclear transport factor 2 family protein [Variovorax sp. J22P271]MDM0033762.1 nuclear transport factor 2 family protein [Variovorax sp. J22P271]
MWRTISRRNLVSATATLAVATGLTLAGRANAQTPSAELDQLLSKQAITELLYKYPRALDRLDRELLLSLGHPDAKVEFGKTVFPNWLAYTDWMMKAHAAMLGNNHRITNILIEVHGDKAVSESTGTATLLVKQDKGDDYEERWMHSRYLDTWSRRGGKWALDGRQTVMDYRRVKPVPAAEVKAQYEMGARTGLADPSYKLFRNDK